LAWKKGESGNRNGRPRRGVTIADELRKLLTANKRKEFAQRLVTMALAGDERAAKLVLEYHDGRPTQHIDLNASVTTEVKLSGPSTTRKPAVE
jgi:hypothetical protein